MYIEQLEIRNYKCFYESGLIRLTPGFNVIVGPNNVGKSALVEALGLRISSKPHRSLRTMPVPQSSVDLSSWLTVAISFEAGEAAQLLVDAGATFSVPTALAANEAAAQDLIARLSQPTRFWFVFENHNCRQDLNSTYLEAFGQLDSSIHVTLQTDHRHHTLAFAPNTTGIAYNQILAEIIRKRVYAFKAERLNVSRAAFGLSRELAPDASNLAEVLHNLQSDNPQKYERLNRYVREIFPDVGWVSPPSSTDQQQQVEIRIWPVEAHEAARDDLAMPLSESGTGIGQVLSMLYILITADHPRIIVIDEPQSFLNPGAVRKLIEILRQHQEHQFIVTTHSPEVITAASPRTLLLLKKERTETQVVTLNPADAQELRVVLAEVGARLSDVFGADRILWVEGATEELCFPLIIEKLLSIRLMGTKVVGVLHTGDLESNDTDRIVRIYRRLSQGSSLLPPAIGFIFDRESRGEAKQADIARTVTQAGSKVAFTKRRMYENYLLNSEAIAAVATDIEGFRPEPVTPQEVSELLESLRHDATMYDRRVSRSTRNTDEWIRSIDGAKALSQVFARLSDQRVTYDKKAYGVKLTEWLLEHQPDELSEVADTLRSILCEP